MGNLVMSESHHTPYIVHESLLVAATLANLHPSHALARHGIISALVACLDGRRAVATPFAQLTNIYVQY
jgi:hypothetical protein